MNAPLSRQILIRISGTDAPGITAAITKTIDDAGAKLLDIEQAVTHGLLSLMVLIEEGSVTAPALEATIRSRLEPFKLDTQVSVLEGTWEVADPAQRFVCTVLAEEIPAKFVSDVSSSLAQAGTNIDSIRKLSSGGLSTLELVCSSRARLNLPVMKERLLSISSRYPGVDLAVQRENLYRRSKRVVVFDMDSTLIQGEVIDELAELLGKKAEVSTLTRKAMEGEMDFQESLIRRVSLLKGLTRADLDKVYAKMKLSPGADVLIKVLKRLGFRIGIISGGFTYFVDRLRQDLGVHYSYANVLEWDGDEITGRVTGLIVDARRKADLMELLAQQEGVLLDQVIAVGDGANDLQMLKKAGLGIAYNAKPITKTMVGTSITKKRMDSILYLLGITDADIAEMGIR